MSLITLLKRLKTLSSLHEECHLWFVNLENIGTSEVVVAQSVLDDAEFKRMKNFYHLTHQNEFAICRFAAKKIIGDILGVFPEDVTFFYTKKGKPYLKDAGVEFNISHSKKNALIGISKHKIGVDIEFINRDEDILKTMDYFLSQDEKNWILESNVWNRFYQIWTLKEARLKCDGEGITISSFPNLIRNENAEWQYPGYHMTSYSINDNYICAICTSVLKF
ncbi:MAG: 4'-phosphopantetheinyl transferase superfamily protein [Candidatus Babeliales bacterium]